MSVFSTCHVCGRTDVVSFGACVGCGAPFDFKEPVAVTQGSEKLAASGLVVRQIKQVQQWSPENLVEGAPQLAQSLERGELVVVAPPAGLSEWISRLEVSLESLNRSAEFWSGEEAGMAYQHAAKMCIDLIETLRLFK